MNLFNQESIMAKLFCPKVEKYQICVDKESPKNLGTFDENFKQNSHIFLKEDSKRESIIWDVQVNKNNGFFPIKNQFDNIVKKQDKENSLNFFPHNLNSVVSIQHIPTTKDSKQEISAVKATNCKCKKTQCLKLYCDCFASGGTCGKLCQCYGCHNTSEYKELRNLIIDEAQQKNPLSFESKYKEIKQENKRIHSRGCNCSKTGCIKNYCECFKEGLGCSRFCKCINCKNEYIDLKEEDVAIYYDKVKRKRRKNFYLYDFYFQRYKKISKELIQLLQFK